MATPGTTKGITQDQPNAKSKHPNSSESQRKSSDSQQHPHSSTKKGPQQQSSDSVQGQGQPAKSRRPLNPLAQKSANRLFTEGGFSQAQANILARELQGAHAHAHKALQETRATDQRVTHLETDVSKLKRQMKTLQATVRMHSNRLQALEATRSSLVVDGKSTHEVDSSIAEATEDIARAKAATRSCQAEMDQLGSDSPVGEVRAS